MFPDYANHIGLFNDSGNNYLFPFGIPKIDDSVLFGFRNEFPELLKETIIT